MTIRETLVKWQEDRIASLEKLNAPQSVIDIEKDRLKEGPVVQGLELYGNKQVEFTQELQTADEGLDPIILFQCKQIFPVLMFTENVPVDASKCELCRDKKPHGHFPTGVTKLVHLHWNL